MGRWDVRMKATEAFLESRRPSGGKHTHLNFIELMEINTQQLFL
jgi:hypothetical protein